jgi:hypothetical protein
VPSGYEVVCRYFNSFFRWSLQQMNPVEKRIAIDQVRVGVFIRLDTWMDHPFLFSSFKIRNEKQLSALRSLGLSEVWYSPEKSDLAPLPPPKPDAPVRPAAES